MNIQVRHNITSLVKERDSAITKLTIAVEAISDLMITVKSATDRSLHSGISNFVGTERDKSKIHKIDALTKEVDILFWIKLITIAQFKEIMHSKKFDQLETQLYNNPPAFTVDNATATLSQLITELPDLLSELVRNTFTCRSKEHKSNGRIKLDKKQVYKSLLSSERGKNLLFDIIRAIAILEGVKNEYTVYDLKAGKEIFMFGDKLKFKVFMNNNVHVTILDDELLDKINDVLNGCYSGQIGVL